MSPTGARVAVVVPARDEQRRVAATLRALAVVPGVDLVVVVDDGSNDRTADVAAQAGAIVVRHQRNRGKGAAMTTGAEEVARIDAREGGEPRLLLFADADLQASAAGLAALPSPVATGQADMAIAVLPPQERRGGGFGLVVRTARSGIRRLTGWTPTQPLSGMRCLTREAFRAATPLAPGWGVEVGITVDVLRAGMRVTEVPCSLQHRVTGRDWRSQLHRARQLRDVTRALAARALRRR